METEMETSQASTPGIPSRSLSRELERGRDRSRPASLTITSPQLDPSPFQPEQTSSQPPSERLSPIPSPSTSSFRSRSRTPTSRSTSPYPSPFIPQELSDSLLPGHGDAGGLQRQPSTRLETATAIRQPSFPQFRNSIITKPSVSLITRPGIIHTQPSQPLARNSPTSPLSGSTVASPPLNESFTGSPDSMKEGKRRQARVSVINITTSSSPKDGTRNSARASLLAGPGPVIRPTTPRPMSFIPDTSPTTSSFPASISMTSLPNEGDQFEDMKVQKILGPQDDDWARPTKEEIRARSTPGIQEVKKMIGDLKDSGDRYGSKGTIRLMKEKMGRCDGGIGGVEGKDLWQSMYSMSGETLGESSGRGDMRTPDCLIVDDEYEEYSLGRGMDGRAKAQRRSSGWGCWCGCFGR